MGYVLATTGTQVRWVQFDPSETLCFGKYRLVEMLDLDQVPVFEDKDIARQAAVSIGLSAWRYVRI